MPPTLQPHKTALAKSATPLPQPQPARPERAQALLAQPPLLLLPLPPQVCLTRLLVLPLKLLLTLL